MTGLRPLALLLCLTVGAIGKDPKLKLAGLQSTPVDSFWRADGRRSASSSQESWRMGRSTMSTPVAGGEAKILVSTGGKKQKLHVTVKGARATPALTAPSCRAPQAVRWNFFPGLHCVA